MSADDIPTWKWPGLGGRLAGSRDHPIFDADAVERATLRGNEIHDAISAAARTVMEERALKQEGQVYKWLRENWPWYVRWAIGYPRAIRVLDRLGLVTMPVFVTDQVVEVPEQLKSSTNVAAEHGGQWRVRAWGYDVTVTAGVSALVWRQPPGSGFVFVDEVPLTLGFAGQPCIWLDMEPVRGTIDEWELQER